MYDLNKDYRCDYGRQPLLFLLYKYTRMKTCKGIDASDWDGHAVDVVTVLVVC